MKTYLNNAIQTTNINDDGTLIALTFNGNVLSNDGSNLVLQNTAEDQPLVSINDMQDTDVYLHCKSYLLLGPIELL